MSAKLVVVDVPTWVYGPPLVVERRMWYSVAPATADQETVAVVWPVALAVTPVGAAGGAPPPPPEVGTTDWQVAGTEPQASLPDGWATTW